MRMTPVLLVVVALVGCGSSGGSDNDGGSSSSGPGSSSSVSGVDSSSSTIDPSNGSSGSSSDGGTTSPGSSESSTQADSSSSGDSGEVMLDGACELDDRVGGFALLREDIYSTFSGYVSDGVVPVSVLQNVGEDGDCKLLRRNNPFCDPSCSPGTTCDFDGNCVAYPVNHDVGTVDVTGLLEAVSVEPIMPTYEYYDTQLPHPAWDEGSVIRLSALGGDYAAFEMDGLGVSMIEPSGDALVLDPDAPLDIEWAAGDGTAKVRVEITIDLHGSTPSKLVCVADDVGMLTVSQELIADFVALGVTGFPNANYYRETVDSIELEPGCVEFGVRSHVQRDLTVAGHTPCTSDGDCTEPQVCDIPNETCIDP